MADSARSLIDEIERRLLAATSDLPTSVLRRLGRTASSALRAARLVRRRGRRADIPLDVDALAGLVASIGELKGIAMKAGQLMSYLDLALPPELTSALALLQTRSQPMPFEQVAEVITAELRYRAAPLLAGMERAPAASASIGQVHRAKLGDGVTVAVKVQYPGIEEAIAADFRPAAVGTRFVRLLAPGANVDAVVREARRAVLEECDYDREATYQERMARIYSGHPTIAVPEVHRTFCARRVLTTTWAEGLRFDAFVARDPLPADRDRIGEALFEFYVGTLFRDGLFNWDPHPGNYVFPPDGRVVLLDHGSTREFTRSFVRRLASLTRAVHEDDPEALRSALGDLGMLRHGDREEVQVARALVRSFYGPMLRDEVLAIERGAGTPLQALVAGKRRLLKLRLPGEILFILRIRFGLMGVLARLGARANWYRIEQRFTEAALARSP